MTSESEKPPTPETDPAAVRRVVIASFMGTMIEWYDFFLYGTAAALVFDKLFFPELDPATGTIAALGTFALGFLPDLSAEYFFPLRGSCRPQIRSRHHPHTHGCGHLSHWRVADI